MDFNRFFHEFFPFWTKMDNSENKKKQNLLYRNVRQNAEKEYDFFSDLFLYFQMDVDYI